jgi:hypothetical protein
MFCVVLVFSCAVGPWCKLLFKGVELSKDEILAPASAIERTALEPKGRDRVHASLASKSASP